MLKTKLSTVAVMMIAGTFLSTNAIAEEKTNQKFVDDSSYAVGVLMGKNIEGVVASQKEIFTYNQDKILAGVQDTIKKTGKLTDEDLQNQLKSLDAYLSDKEAKIAEEKNKVTVAAGDQFRANYKKQSDVKETNSGLLYKIEKIGEGDSPKTEDTVKVHYKGSLTDGTVFDSSYDRGEPIEFQLNQLIPGWIEAIPMLKKGGKMEIVVPPKLGYGERTAGKIPAHSTLKFEIELLDFKAVETKK